MAKVYIAWAEGKPKREVLVKMNWLNYVKNRIKKLQIRPFLVALVGLMKRGEMARFITTVLFQYVTIPRVETMRTHADPYTGAPIGPTASKAMAGLIMIFLFQSKGIEVEDVTEIEVKNNLCTSSIIGPMNGGAIKGFTMIGNWPLQAVDWIKSDHIPTGSKRQLTRYH